MQKILVIDDVYTVRLKVQLILRNAGSYDVSIVSSGDEGLAAVQTDPPDAIVLDVVMAGRDGIETLQELRNQGIDCPVVAYTARPERTPGEFLGLGFDAYVPKSENLSTLIRALRSLLQARHVAIRAGAARRHIADKSARLAAAIQYTPMFVQTC